VPHAGGVGVAGVVVFYDMRNASYEIIQIAEQKIKVDSVIQGAVIL